MIYLAQTDTTAGFLSKNLEEINALKGRAKDQPCLITSAKFDEWGTFHTNMVHKKRSEFVESEQKRP